MLKEKKTWQQEYNKINQKMIMEAVKCSEGENVVISTASLFLLLALMMNATSGSTQEEIKRIIAESYEIDEFNEILSNLQKNLTRPFAVGGRLNIANSIIADESLKDSLKEEYCNFIKNCYKAEVLSGPKNEVIDKINEWVNKNTKGMIPQIINFLPNDFKLCFLNAIAFEAKWKHAYEDYDIELDRDFTNVDFTKSKVTMLTSNEDTYVENEFYEGFVKPYRGDKYSFMGLLPKKAKSKSFFSRALEEIDFSTLYHQRTEAEVIVEMPEYEIKTSLELNQMLSDMGIIEAFSDESNFSNIVSDQKIKVDTVLQKAYIKVDHNGTKAAAATGCFCGFGGFGVEKIIHITLDRPFVYAIIDNETGLPVFSGVVKKL